jgi:hypothetical protein
MQELDKHQLEALREQEESEALITDDEVYSDELEGYFKPLSE